MNFANTPNTQTIAPARHRQGTTPNIHRRHESAQNKLVASCMPKTAEFEPRSSSKRKVVTKAPDLPLALLNPFGEVRMAMDSLEWSILNGKSAKPALTAAVEAIRDEIKKGCQYYEPTEARNIEAGLRESYPTLPDGKGLMCASGTPGHAVYRGRLCTHVCTVADVQTGRRNFVPVESLVAAASQINHDIVPEQAV